MQQQEEKENMKLLGVPTEHLLGSWILKQAEEEELRGEEIIEEEPIEEEPIEKEPIDKEPIA